MRTIISRLLDVVFRRQRENRLSEEIQAHLEMLADEHQARGLSPADARLAAHRAFGGVDQLKEQYRDRRGFPVVDGLLQDLRYASRLIVRDKWFSAATVAALALGIGATATMGSILYCMNLRDLPFANPAALVAVGGEPNRSQGGQVSYAIFDAWRSSARGITGMAAYAGVPINLGDEQLATDQFAGTFISHNGFSLLGERPVLGRDFVADDDRLGAAAVVIIGHRVWTDRYGADPSVIGRAVRANGQPATIIGVMREGFMFPVDSQVWQPFMALPAMQTAAGSQRPVQIVARLSDGLSPEAEHAELTAIVSTLATVPEADRTRRPVVMPLNEAYFGSALQPVPMMMLAAVGIVLLIACSHAASLLLARASARSREMSMRAALGASRGRIIRQLLVESVFLALMAGVLGIAIATAGLRLFAAETAGFGMPYWARFTFDVELFGYVSLLCLATGIGFGLLPALQMSKTNLASTLNQGGRSGMTNARGRQTTTVLLVGELALTVTLLAGAGALVQSANVVSRSDHTIDLKNLWSYRLALPQPQYEAKDKRLDFYRRLDERLAAAPGVESAALAGSMPFNARESRLIRMDNESVDSVAGDSGSAPASGPAATARLVAVGSRYFDTLGLTVIRGRRFEDLDVPTRSQSALVNERFVERFSAGVEVVGRQVVLVNERTPGQPAERFTIVGIAPAMRQEVAAGQTPVVYVPHVTQPATTAALIIRGNPERFAEVLRQEVRRIDPDLPLFNLVSLERISDSSRWIQRILSTAFSVVAVIAVVLSTLGLYALAAYSTTQRTQEVGVRIALGATGPQVLWLFLRRTLFQVSLGLTIGLAGAVALGTVLEGVLVEVRANRPLTLAGVAILLVGISIAASLLPARKASRLDPVAALRAD